MKQSLEDKEIHLKGLSISHGVAIGQAFLFAVTDDNAPDFFISPDDVEREIFRFQQAIEKSRLDIIALQEKLRQERINEGAEILDAHLQIMQDPLLTVAVESEIRHTRKNAEYVFESLVKSYQKKFQQIKDAFFRERFKDIQDISRRVMGYLCDSIRVSLADIPPGSIVFARELTASDAAEARGSDVVAFITETGGTTSHAAIVAKAKGIPFITGISFEKIQSISQKVVIVDGGSGTVILNPKQETLALYSLQREAIKLHRKSLEEGMSYPAETFDGYHMKLSANLDMISELDLFPRQGNHGIGLFRSEYIFLTNNEFPPEDAQYEIYKRIIQKLDGLPIVIRTFDVGGDKQLRNNSSIKKTNPFLGCRALRFLLQEQGVFKEQLRAILRAAVNGNVSLLFPMVSALSELREAKTLLKEVESELEMEGLPFGKNLRIGCMIEVPSAAIIADLLAKECDFLSIGTNDLVQYSLAVDRSNHAQQRYYTPTDPGVIRLIKMIVNEANKEGIPVSICGEIAADPRFTPLLLGLGVHELSLSSRHIPLIKNAVRNISIVDATALAKHVLSLTTAQDILDLLVEEYRKTAPRDCCFNVK